MIYLFSIFTKSVERIFDWLLHTYYGISWAVHCFLTAGINIASRFATVSPENDILATNDAGVRTNTKTATMVVLSVFTGR